MSSSRFERYLERILRPEQWKNLAPDSTVVTVQKNTEKVELFYIGIEHLYVLSDPRCVLLENYFTEFVQRHPLQTISIKVEGVVPNQNLPLTQLVKKYGEAGLITHLARQAHLEPTSLEPQLRAQINVLRKKFDIPVLDIASWLFVNMLWGLVRQHKLSEASIIQTFTTITRVLKIFSFQDLMRHLNQSIGAPLFPDAFEEFKNRSFDALHLQKLQSPFEDTSALNNVGRAMNYTRDWCMAKSILQQLDHKKNVFAIAGNNHVLAQKSAFEGYFKKKKSATRPTFLY